MRPLKKLTKLVVDSKEDDNNSLSADLAKELDIEIGVDEPAAVSNENEPKKKEKHKPKEIASFRLVVDKTSASRTSVARNRSFHTGRTSVVSNFGSNESSNRLTKKNSEKRQAKSIRSIRSSSRQLEVSELSDSDSREKIETIKLKNKSMFPDVQSRLFVKPYKKNTYPLDVWEDTLVDETEENARLASMSNRSELVFYLGIKEQIYNAFQQFNNLYESDHRDYTEYQEKRIRHGIKPFTFTRINIVFD